MQNVALPGTCLETTVLGFGCGRLLRESSARRRGRLLGEAYESGIRHFDVAPSYGLGVAEEDVGRFAKGKRARLIIATKYGLDVNHRGRKLRAFQGVLRPLLSAFPALRRLARSHGASLLVRRRHDSVTALRSLEASLRSLKTDYIDLFLLHEPSLETVADEEIGEFLEGQRRRGTIRAYGVAGKLEEIVRLCQAVPKVTSVAQFANDALSRNITRMEKGNKRGVITFSPFSGSLDAIVRHVGRDRATQARWRKKVGRDCTDRDDVACLLLQYCLQSNHEGVVLFSTSNPARIRALAGVALSTMDPASVRGFLEMILADPPPGDETLRSRAERTLPDEGKGQAC